jgi:DNA-binding NarL/FixJ family response regulator
MSPVHEHILLPLRSSAGPVPPGRMRRVRAEDGPAAAAPIRVLVVDDHAGVRAALVDLLGGTGGIALVGEATDGRDALELAARLHPDVVLMDVSMPKMSGLEATRVLTRQRPDIHVIMLSSDGRCSVVRAARDAGAVGFLVKRSRGIDLVAAIMDAHAGRPTWPVCP